MDCHQENNRPRDDVSRPGGEPSQLPPRVLYGYVRVVRGDTARAAALKAELLTFCHSYGYMLGTVFTDYGVEDTAIARPGFSSLLDVCKLVGSHGVVVPARSHLSTHDETLAVLLRQIRRTGVKLIAADEFAATSHGTTDASATDGGTPC
ncbi:recombinase family protein [Kibdelosporangium aridum]|uniref:recombinase family protein n=1 Tax=Kibdelosporangium aridum TaxID=2030 RepID=UPI00068D2983|nr:recombinase family protein [Kibdelosporangium aridum]